MMNVFTLEIDPREIKLLETNARYMKHEEFNRLVENIRRDGKLTSTPFLCKDDDDRWLCLSGNHRTRAAIEVGLPTITSCYPSFRPSPQSTASRCAGRFSE